MWEKKDLHHQPSGGVRRFTSEKRGKGKIERGENKRRRGTYGKKKKSRAGEKACRQRRNITAACLQSRKRKIDGSTSERLRKEKEDALSAPTKTHLRSKGGETCGNGHGVSLYKRRRYQRPRETKRVG